MVSMGSMVLTSHILVAVHVPPRGFVISFFCKQLRQCFTLLVTSIPACFESPPFIWNFVQGWLCLSPSLLYL